MPAGVFSQELDALWQAAVEAIGSQCKEQAAEAILKYAYYWYNFMPLARGSAMVGYTTILSLFLAAGMPLSAAIPQVRIFVPLPLHNQNILPIVMQQEQ